MGTPGTSINTTTSEIWLLTTSTLTLLSINVIYFSIMVIFKLIYISPVLLINYMINIKIVKVIYIIINHINLYLYRVPIEYL